MTRDEFGLAYQMHFRKTILFLMANGLSADAAQETAQAAWTRGWERLSQLRDVRTLLIWLNRVALNLYRSVLRREPEYEELASNVTAPDLNLAAIDAETILGHCNLRDRRMLRDYYLKGLHLSEIAARHGWRENTARVRLFRARQAARFWITAPGAEERHRPVRTGADSSQAGSAAKHGTLPECILPRHR